MNANRLGSVLKTSAANWVSHDAPRLGAALAFYTLLSLSPLVLLAVAIAALVFDRPSAQNELLSQVQQMVGLDGRRMMQSILESAQKPSSGIFSSAVSLVTLLFGASGVFSELREALNRIAGIEADPAINIYRIVRERLFSFGMVLAIGFLLVVSLVFSASLAVLQDVWDSGLPLPAGLLECVHFLVSLLSIAALFALMFRYIPERRVPWGDVAVGALATALLFTIGKTLIGLYIGKAGVGSTYGAAGSVMVIIVWVYYSAQIFFFGAEFTHVWARARNEEGSGQS